MKYTFPTCACLLFLGLIGCASTPMNTPYVAVKMGDWKAAQQGTESEINDDTSSRRWMLTRMRAGVCALDAGDTRAALAHFSEAYGIIRTQGLNADRTIPAYLVNESVKIWKGEPFEQAMMLAYYGVLQAQLNSWDNCRAASDNALFSLRDLDHAGPAGPVTGNGYITAPTDFALGHLLLALSAQQMKRPEEATDHFNQVAQLRPELAADLNTFRADRYNTVLVVAYGLGPKKEAYAPGNARGVLADKTCTRYVPLTYDNGYASLQVNTGGDTTAHLPILNLNRMADDHRWRDLEDVRKIKSVIGNVAAVGGAVVALDGLNRGNGKEALIGAAILGVGALIKTTAHAQTEYCDTFPQRMFVVPLWLDKPTTVSLYLPNITGTTQVLVSPPTSPQAEAKMVYVRLPGY